MIDPKAEPIDNRPPYKPIEVSGRKPSWSASTEARDYYRIDGIWTFKPTEPKE